MVPVHPKRLTFYTAYRATAAGGSPGCRRLAQRHTLAASCQCDGYQADYAGNSSRGAKFIWTTRRAFQMRSAREPRMG